MDLGSTIRKLRKERRLTLKEVGATAGISNNALVAIEKNRSFPSKETFYAICQGLGTKPFIVLLECVTIDDIPQEKREAFKVIWPPIMEYLRSNEENITISYVGDPL